MPNFPTQPDFNFASSDTLTLWIPGTVVINQSGAPRKRPMSVSYGNWWAQALKQVVEQRQGFREKYPIERAAVKISFVGDHPGAIASLVHSVASLMSYTDFSKQPTLRGYALDMENYPELEIHREPEGAEGTGLRIEICPLE
jgi:hypothetical protein